MQQQSIGCLCVVLTVQVQISQLVQVPVTRAQRLDTARPLACKPIGFTSQSDTPNVNVLPLLLFVEILQEGKKKKKRGKIWCFFFKHFLSSYLHRWLLYIANSITPLVNIGRGHTSTLTVQLMRCSGLSSCVMVRYASRFSSRLLSSRASSSPDWDRYLWRLQCSNNLHIPNKTKVIYRPLFNCKGKFLVHHFAKARLSFWQTQ